LPASENRKDKGLPLTPTLSPGYTAGEGAKLVSLSPNSTIVGGEGWGEGEAFAPALFGRAKTKA